MFETLFKDNITLGNIFSLIYLLAWPYVFRIADVNAWVEYSKWLIISKKLKFINIYIYVIYESILITSFVLLNTRLGITRKV